MRLLHELFENNRKWAAGVKRESPDFFEKLAIQQTPQFFWIGCADSRVPANEIIGLLPGEVFVHRNIANVVNPSDKNCLACLQYAIEVLNVKHVMVVGHYGCGGVKAVVDGQYRGLVGEWLAPVRAIHRKYEPHLDSDENSQWEKLCELNVIEQAAATWQTAIVQGAWAAGKEVAVHGWIYSIGDGLLRDLNVTVSRSNEGENALRQARAMALETKK